MHVSGYLRTALVAAVLGGMVSGIFAEDHTIHDFKKVRLTEEYFAEGASCGDFNQDGHQDVVCGPNWFAGPDFTDRHRFYDGQSFPNDRGYSDNFFSYVHDFSGDGWDDILVIGLPGTPAYWYENPQSGDYWKKHFAFPVVDNEAPVFADLTGDGVPELCCTYEGRLGFAAPVPEAPQERWQWHPISDRGEWHKYSHGLGVGDVNGDGRNDILMPEGWWEQPEEGAENSSWKHYPARFAVGGAQIYAFDVDGDGDNDVVSSQNAHAYGLSWFEHVKSDDGGITFREHKIMGENPSENPYGVAFSQLHALDCVDVDDDGRRDIVTGKCYWAHNGSDPGARDPAVLYWFRNTERHGEVEFVPHLIDDNSGVGRQITVADVNGDNLVDIMAGNKKGTFLFLHSTREVSHEEWQQAQPQRRRNTRIFEQKIAKITQKEKEGTLITANCRSSI